MALETGTYISDLVSTNPTGSDQKNTADDHIRLIKSTVKTTFPNVSGAVTPTHTELNYVDGVTSAIQTQIDTKGAHAGQVWTGTHNYTGATLTMTTQSQGDNTTKGATTSYVDTGLALKGNINAQTWTGTHTFSSAIVVPTMTAGDNSTNAASTAFTSAAIAAAAFSTALPSQSGNAGKYVTTNGTTASWASVPAAGMTLISTASASGSAAIDFTSGIDSTYDEYEIHFLNVKPSTNLVNLYLLASKDAGAAWLSSNYKYVNFCYNGGTSGEQATASQAQISLNLTFEQLRDSVNSLVGASGVVRIIRPSSSRYCMFNYELKNEKSSGTFNVNSGSGMADAGNTFTVNAIRFLMSSGNIASGEFKLYGLKKS